MALLLLAAVLASLIATTVNAASSASPVASATDASSLVGATTHPIEYRIGCPPSMVDDGVSLAYFKAHGFSAVDLVVPDTKTYQTELTTIKSFGMTPIIDVEIPIWNGGQLQSTPITSFGAYFQSLKNAGWEYVASEGGRVGDLTYMQQFFKGYVNYNCDQCGLWLDVYKNPFTITNSWESYYPSEWPYIQQGTTQAAALGIQNGIMAGVWANNGGDNQILTNSLNGGSPSYKSMLDWSYANGVGFNQFCAWCGFDSYGLSMYQQLGFEQIVANLQTYYPAITAPYQATTALNAAVSTATAYVNQNFTINGALSAGTTGIDSQTITMQRSTDNATWNNVTTDVTNATGGYQFSNNESAAGTYYYRTTYAGNATYTNATSNVVNVTVGPKIAPSLNATAPTTANVTQNFTVKGQLTAGTTNLAGQNVTLQRSTDNATWTPLTTNKTNATGGYAFSRNESAVGTYFYLTTYAGNATYTNATSNTVNVTVSPLSTSLTAVAPSTTHSTQNFTVRGNLTSGGKPLAGKTITLQNSTDNATWTNVTPPMTNTTNAAGAYSFSMNETASGVYYYRTTYAGNATYLNATSNVVKVTVGLSTSLTAVAPSTAYTTQNFTVSGSLTVSGSFLSGGKPLNGQSITLQRSTDKTTWTNVTPPMTNTTNAAGAYSFSMNETASGVYYYRTTYAGNATYLNATSNVVNVTVTKMPAVLTAATPTTATVNTLFTVQGKLAVNTTTNHMGIGNATVTLLTYNATSKQYDITLVTTTTNATSKNLGAYVFSVKETTAGTYSYEVTFAGTATYLPRTSAPVKVVVR